MSDRIHVFHHWDHGVFADHFARHGSESEALLSLASSTGKVCGSIVGWVSDTELTFCRSHGFSTGALIRDPLDRGMSLLRIIVQSMPEDTLTVGPMGAPKIMGSIWAIVERVYQRSGRDLWKEIKQLKSNRKLDERHKSIWLRYQFVSRFLYNVLKNDIQVMRQFTRPEIHRFEDLTRDPDIFRAFACDLVPAFAIDDAERTFGDGIMSANRRSNKISNNSIINLLEKDFDFVINCIQVIIETFHEHEQDIETTYSAFGYDLIARASELANLKTNANRVDGVA